MRAFTSKNVATLRCEKEFPKSLYLAMMLKIAYHVCIHSDLALFFVQSKNLKHLQDLRVSTFKDINVQTSLLSIVLWRKTLYILQDKFFKSVVFLLSKISLFKHLFIALFCGEANYRLSEKSFSKVLRAQPLIWKV